MQRLRSWHLGILGGGLFVAGMAFGYAVAPGGSGFVSVPGIVTTSTGRVLGVGQSARVPLDGDVDFTLFWEAWNAVKDRYYERPVSDKDLFYGAITGLVNGVDDPYTSYFPPQEASEFEQQLEGKFEGIGAQIEVKDKVLQIVAPLDSSPAEKAGLRSGDIIVSIDGKSTEGLSVDQAARTIRGEKGTSVTLVIYRPGAKTESFTVTIIRDEIKMKSVKLHWDGSYAILEISAFNTDTLGLFEQAVQEIRLKKAKGLVVDVRNNPGGAVTTAQAVAGAWIGDDVLFQERRQGKVIESVRGIGRRELAGIPTVVLMNGGSASASEILAGALQDYQLAVTIGTKSFGKGSVQEYEPLSDGSALKITIAEWITPKGRAINHVGLEPMISVERTDQDYEAKRDPQLERAKQFLREGGTPATFGTSTAPRT